MSEAMPPPDAIRSKLQAGETLAWWDRPNPRLVAKREFGVHTLSGAFMLLFGLFWIYNAARAEPLFALFGVPILGIALWIVSAPFRAQRDAASVLYALTDQRALILSPGKVAAYPLGRVEFVETQDLENGLGHVLFFDEVVSSPLASLGTYGQQTRKSGFLGVAEADRVARQLQSAMTARGRDQE